MCVCVCVYICVSVDIHVRVCICAHTRTCLLGRRVQGKGTLSIRSLLFFSSFLFSLSLFFWLRLGTCGSSQARDPTHAIALMSLDPQPPEPPGNSPWDFDSPALALRRPRLAFPAPPHPASQRTSLHPSAPLSPEEMQGRLVPALFVLPEAGGTILGSRKTNQLKGSS